ncbi:hypothetical protein BDN72DRAFT_844179 [Pluteus cervinus]|uniref:Uncharacterized protein n=1 Tax=Pluteus cervinus TaxID=181527 RepID=A0ACD3ANS6_9AGAR|nr:hypothetical protein BDN72DRAFT_844179 [Pluteus cervinus]
MASTKTDSVSVFAEGTYEEQIQELVNYIVRSRSDEERAAFIRPFQESLKNEKGSKPLAEDSERRKQLLSMVLDEVKGLGDGNEKEIEGFFNLLLAHFLTLYTLDSPEGTQRLHTLLETVAKAPPEHISIKYRVLSNLFNALPRNSPSRLAVYNTLLDLATSNDELSVLQISQDDVRTWLSEWAISQEQKTAFLKRIIDAYNTFGQPIPAYQYSLILVKFLPPGSPDSTTTVVDVIATALRLPTTFDFDSLLKIDGVIAVKTHELFSLLQVFLNGGLKEFIAWEASHPGALEKYNLKKTELERKIRLLALSSLGFKYVGQDLAYSKVAEALQIDISEVEKWVIDVIRAGLLVGKLSQTQQTLHIIRSTARTFEKEQWEVLEKRLLAWKAGLASVLEVVASARRAGGGGVPHASAQTQTA